MEVKDSTYEFGEGTTQPTTGKEGICGTRESNQSNLSWAQTDHWVPETFRKSVRSGRESPGELARGPQWWPCPGRAQRAQLFSPGVCHFLHAQPLRSFQSGVSPLAQNHMGYFKFMI